jgi:outer membrane protein OmpA-like peptidoglycan-associated protein
MSWCVFAPPALAQEAVDTPPFEAAIYGGGFLATKRHQFYDTDLAAPPVALARLSPEFGARFAYYPLRFLGVELEGGLILSHTDDDARGEADVKLFALRAHVIAQLPGRISPFVLLGGGSVWSRSSADALGDDVDGLLHGAVGARLFVTRSLTARVEARLLRGPSSMPPFELTANYGEFLLGVGYAFGRAPRVRDDDADRDGFRGTADACPEEAGEAPDGCPPRDADRDGILDRDDRCPDKAETPNGLEDADGCPDELPDLDGDGLRGEADQCQNDPEDPDKFNDEDGCPDPDNDNDSVLDAADGCPNEAGTAENNGCPDKDRDGDGVVDRLDNCPDEAGTAEFQGCKTKQQVVLTKDQLKILDKVFFRSGKAEISRRSHGLLNQVAAVIKAHPELTKIRVEGYTDSQGDDGANKKLSQARAEAVARYLVSKGVEYTRLEPIGFGEDKPIADNATRSGRRENRRVEFNITAGP